MTKQYLKLFLKFLKNIAKEYMRILCSGKQGIIFTSYLQGLQGNTAAARDLFLCVFKFIHGR